MALMMSDTCLVYHNFTRLPTLIFVFGAYAGVYGKPAKGWYHAHILINLRGVFPYVISFHNARRIGAVYHAAAIRKPGAFRCTHSVPCCRAGDSRRLGQLSGMAAYRFQQ